MKVKSFFDTHPVFRYEEFVEFIHQQGIDRIESVRQQLSYHHKVGNLLRVRKCLYAVKPSSIVEDNYWVDAYLIASKATPDAIIGYHTALELHDLAYSTFEELTFLTHRPSQPFAYQGQRFRSVQFPKALLLRSNTEYGIEFIQRQGINIHITNLERTIVDILDRPNLAGGWEEIWRSLDHVIHFDPKKLVEYTLLLNNATTVAKVGFFLEQRPSHLTVDPGYIEQLKPFVPKKPHYMDRSQRNRAKYFEKWQLMVPLAIIERQWEESDVADI